MSVFFFACRVCMCVSLHVYPTFHSVCILLFIPCVSFSIPCVYPILCVSHSVCIPLSITSLKVCLAPSLTLKPWSQLCSERLSPQDPANRTENQIVLYSQTSWTMSSIIELFSVLVIPLQQLHLGCIPILNQVAPPFQKFLADDYLSDV